MKNTSSLQSFIPSSFHSLIPFFLLLLIPSFLLAQVPQGIPYQAVIRDNAGAPLVNTPILVRFTLHQNTTDGAIEYQETQSATTNAFGVINTQFGTGTATQGTFAGIVWSNTSKFIQVEANDGNGYLDMGTQQMMSVPYAMYAVQSGGISGSNNSSSSQNGCYSCPTMISGISATTMNITDAVGYCSNLNEQGYNDWRIPTLDEFEYLRDVQNASVPSEACWTKNFDFVQTKGYTNWPNRIYISSDRGTIMNSDSGQALFKTVCIR